MFPIWLFDVSHVKLERWEGPTETHTQQLLRGVGADNGGEILGGVGRGENHGEKLAFCWEKPWENLAICWEKPWET